MSFFFYCCCCWQSKESSVLRSAMPRGRFNLHLSHRSSKKKRKLAPSSLDRRAEDERKSVYVIRVCVCVHYIITTVVFSPFLNVLFPSLCLLPQQSSQTLSYLRRECRFFLRLLCSPWIEWTTVTTTTRRIKKKERRKMTATLYTMSSISRPTGCVEFSLSFILSFSLAAILKKKERKFLSLSFGLQLAPICLSTQQTHTHGTSENEITTSCSCWLRDSP